VSYEIHFLWQEWDQLLEQQREIEDKLQELEASPPRFMFI
jgi:lysine-specific histone demethylase 1